MVLVAVVVVVMAVVGSSRGSGGGVCCGNGASSSVFFICVGTAFALVLSDQELVLVLVSFCIRIAQGDCVVLASTSRW